MADHRSIQEELMVPNLQMISIAFFWGLKIKIIKKTVFNLFVKLLIE